VMSVKPKPSTSRQRVGSKIALTAAVPMTVSLRAATLGGRCPGVAVRVG
jgi:hypothetical protein